MDLRTPSRWFAALLMPLGPAAVAILRFVLPYDTPDTPAQMVDGVLAAPGVVAVLSWLGLVALLTLVPGALAALRLVRPGAPVLGAVAGLLLVPGYLALFGPGVTESVIVAGHDAGIDPTSLALLVDASYADPVAAICGTIFVVGHLAGTVVLGFALWRSGVVHPAWAVVMGVSQPLHLVAAMTGNHPLDLVGWGMTAVAMGAAAYAVVRTADAAWDVAPRTTPLAAAALVAGR
ncbi:hypothetical protein IF650_04195 [Cellulosimicrobium terreum]|nr:hypothetical protein [Cellulosimicrobium terreum]